MIDWEKLKQDRKAGTPGAWEVRHEKGLTHLYMIDHPGLKTQMCDETYYPWVPENPHDWERIARVPDLETLALAGRELARAAEIAESQLEKMGSDGFSSGLTAALAAWRKLEGKDE